MVVWLLQHKQIVQVMLLFFVVVVVVVFHFGALDLTAYYFFHYTHSYM